MCFLFVTLSLLWGLTSCDSPDDKSKDTYCWYDADGTLLFEQTITAGDTPTGYELPADTDKWDYIKWQDGNDSKEKIAYRIPKNSYFVGNVFQIIVQDLGEQPIVTGSAFVFNCDGWFITNAHVMEDAYYAKAIFNIPNSATGESYTYLNINSGSYYHLDKDIYIGRIENYSSIVSHYKDIPIDTTYEIGEQTYSVGYPNSSAELIIKEGKVTESWSDIYEKLYSGNSYICSSSYIAPGSSGGVLTNENLEVIGITTLGWTDENDEFISGAAISAFNFNNLLQSTNEKDLISLIDRFHNDEKIYIGLFNDMRADEAEGITTKVFFEDGSIAYEYETLEEGVNEDNVAYVRNITLLSGTDRWMEYTDEIFWTDGGRRIISFYGYYDNQKGIANFKYEFEYKWKNGKYYTVECSNINYSPNVSLTLNRCVVDSPYSYTVTDENIKYAKEQFNYIYEYLTELMASYEHSFGEWKTVKEATCTEEGMRERVCDCGEKEIEIIVAVGHSFGEWSQTKAPSCTETGVKQRGCACGEKETETIAAYGHSFGEWAQTKAPNCTEKGATRRDCDDCDFYETKDVKANGHKESGFVVDVAATLYVEGRKHTYCMVCSEDMRTNIVIPKIVSYGLSYSVNSDKKTCTITGIGSCTDTEVGIPPTINGYKVISIADNAFNDTGYGRNSKITGIAIPDGVTTIGEYAFAACCSLKKIAFGKGVKSVGYRAFEFLSIDDVYIDDIAAWCSISWKGDYSHPHDSRGTNLHLKGQLVTDLIIPDGVTSIGEYAFYSYASITSITICSSVTNINVHAFYGCSNITSVSFEDNSELTEIGRAAFFNCYDLTSVTFGKNSKLTNIGEAAFGNCNIVSIKIPDSMTFIGKEAFLQAGLVSVYIPINVTRIGDEAFKGCYDFAYINYEGTKKQWENITKGSNWKHNKTITICCIDGILEA